VLHVLQAQATSSATPSSRIDYVEEAKRLVDEAGRGSSLPVDVVVGDAMEEGAETETVSVDAILLRARMGLDIRARERRGVSG
jgi:3-phosphoglycerate kinase